MNTKHITLLNYLNTQNDWATASTIANKLNISVRSVKNYISEINSKETNLILSSNKGYKINHSNTPQFTEYQSFIPQLPEERINYIIKQLIFSHTSINFYELCDEIYISESTLKSDLEKIRKKLEPFHLALNFKKNELSIDGSEKNKRKIMSAIFCEELNNGFISISKLQNYYPNYDITYLQEILRKQFKENLFLISDYALMNLVLHITIAIDRIIHDNSFCPSDCSQAWTPDSLSAEIELNTTVYQMTKKIAVQIEEKYDITYSTDELNELYLLIICSITNLNHIDMGIDIEHLKNIIGEPSINLILELINEINNYYYINLKDLNLVIFFAMHIKNLLIRCQNHISLNNPMAEKIKSDWPLIYDCAINISHKFFNLTGFSCNEDEIAYIALHIGGILESQKNAEGKIICTLLTPEYCNTQKQLSEKILSSFLEEIILQSTISSEDDLNKICSDLIISSIPLSTPHSIPLVEISPFFTDQDKKKLSKALEKIKNFQKREHFQANLKLITNPKFFIYGNNFNNKNEVISHICKIMYEEGYVSKEFEKEIYQREHMASTSFGSIAIPHSMQMNSYKTGMFIVLSPTGIPWDNNKVNIVLLLSSNSLERKLFLEVFDTLTMFLPEEANTKKLSLCHTYEIFIETLTQLVYPH